MMAAVRVVCALATAVAGTLVFAAPARADGIRDSEWHLAFLDVANAQRQTMGAGVTVAVIDSGVDATHPDLVDSVLTGVDVSTGAAAPTGGAPGQFDVDGRGTGLAGLIVGHGRGTGADGVLGIAPRAQVLPIRITNRAGQFGDPDVLADGINAAVTRGVKVICIGRGMPASPRLEQAVSDAVKADVVVVAATANRRGETFLPWPASYPGVVGIAPLDRVGGLADPPPSPRPPLGLLPQATPLLAAPGVDLVTTDTGGGYRIDGGTGSAAIVAGATALIRAKYPQLPADEVIHRLTATAKDRGASGRDDDYGFGVLDLGAALAPGVPLLRPPAASAAPSASVARPAPAPSTAGPVASGPVSLPAFDSGDWRRWLIVLPLLAFLAGLVAYAVTSGRRRRNAAAPPA